MGLVGPPGHVRFPVVETSDTGASTRPPLPVTSEQVVGPFKECVVGPAGRLQ